MNTDRYYCVYILASKRNGTLYIGVTRNLELRVQQHKEGRGSTFTKKYKVHRLVYFELFQYVSDAIYREKILKKWRRKDKLELIEEMNPQWNDLSTMWYE